MLGLLHDQIATVLPIVCVRDAGGAIEVVYADQPDEQQQKQIDAFVARYPNTKALYELRLKPQFIGGIHRIGDQFAKENVMITVKEFLDDGKDVLRMNPYLTFLHVLGILSTLCQMGCQYLSTDRMTTFHPNRPI